MSVLKFIHDKIVYPVKVSSVQQCAPATLSHILALWY